MNSAGLICYVQQTHTCMGGYTLEVNITIHNNIIFKDIIIPSLFEVYNKTTTNNSQVKNTLRTRRNDGLQTLECRLKQETVSGS